MVEREQVLAALSAGEPDYVQAAVLGPAALPHLAELVLDGDEEVAPAAAYFAGLVGGEGAVPILSTALRADDPALRRAAAMGVARIDPVHRPPLLATALKDDDPEVLRHALDAISDRARREVLSHVIRIAGRPDLPRDIRGLAERTLGRQRGPEPIHGPGGPTPQERLGNAAKRLRGRFRRKKE